MAQGGRCDMVLTLTLKGVRRERLARVGMVRNQEEKKEALKGAIYDSQRSVRSCIY